MTQNGCAFYAPPTNISQSHAIHVSYLPMFGAECKHYSFFFFGGAQIAWHNFYMTPCLVNALNIVQLSDKAVLIANSI